ncbi:MAG: glycosyltransferase family 2 protein [Terriglobia bacterium]
MNWVFALSLAFIAYSVAGYPLAAYLKSRWRYRPVRSAPGFPSVSVVMAVHNEAPMLPQKLQNLLRMDYPCDRYEIIVVSDGSTDSTMDAIRGFENGRVRALALPRHEGKASALNLGVQSAHGEIIVFTDARQQIEDDAVKNLVANFADPEVGCVSGELMLGACGESQSQSTVGAGLYWRVEKLIRQWESAAGSVVGATGALYAARKRFLGPLPKGTLLDDIYHPLHVCRQGGRVIFEARARAWDEVAASRREFRRKVRTLAGNYQLLRLAPWLLTRSNPVRFAFISHKLTRLLVPFALVLLFISSCLATGPVYKVAIALQLVFYGLALLSFARLRLGIFTRLADVALTFLMLNVAAAVALVYFVIGKEVWVR